MTITETPGFIIGGFETEYEKRQRLYLTNRAPGEPITRSPAAQARREQLARIKDALKICKAAKIPTNGCGANGWKRMIVKQLNKPWWLFGLCNFRPYCQLHDFRYWVGGSEMDRINADQEFYDGICLEVCFKFRIFWNRGIEYGHITANAYYAAVSLGGREQFSYHMKKRSSW